MCWYSDGNDDTTDIYTKKLNQYTDTQSNLDSLNPPTPYIWINYWHDSILVILCTKCNKYNECTNFDSRIIHIVIWK